MLGGDRPRQVRAILESAEELWERDGRAYLRPSAGLATWAEQKLDEIRETVRGACGAGVEVEIVRSEAKPASEAGSATEANNPEPEQSVAAEHPLVQSVARAFGAKIVKVERKGTQDA
ncbi:MAG: hypothetical protein IIB66_00580 [Proteobacteria bacterium]|nr:hypothetical protein [Pseudomonadota bacterium]